MCVYLFLWCFLWLKIVINCQNTYAGEWVRVFCLGSNGAVPKRCKTHYFLSSFLEYEVLVVVTDWYDFEFSIKAAGRKRWAEVSAHIQETEIIDNRNVHNRFKVTSGIQTIKTTWLNHGEIRFLKNREKHYHTF